MISTTDAVIESDLLYNKFSLNISITPKKLKCKTIKDSETETKEGNLAELSQHLLPEDVLLALLTLISEHREHVYLYNSMLRVNADQIELLQKINYSFEYLCHIPLSFEYDSSTNEYVFDFTHLSKNIRKVTNLEQINEVLQS